MSLYWRKTYILAKVETTYGTDPTPDGTNAIKIRDAQITPLAGSTEDRALMRPTLGASPKIHVGIHRKAGFAVEIAGAGGAGTVPGYGALLRASGLAETVTAATKVEYTPISTGFESAALWFYKDGQLRKLLGSRGTIGLSFQAKSVPLMKFDLLGLWSAAADSAPPTPTYTGFADPLPVSKTNTPTFTLHGQALPLKSLDISLGTNPVHRNMVNQEMVHIPDRQTTGTITFEWPNLGTLDVESVAKAGTLGALALVHGTAGGAIVQVDAPKVQILEPTMVEDEGLVMCQAQLLFVPDAGDDEIKLTVK